MSRLAAIAARLARPRLLAALAAVLVGAALAMAAPARDDGADSGAAASGERPRLAVLDFEGAIGPVTADYLKRGLAEADRRGADVIVLAMDTPGGLLQSTRDITEAILNSDVPVATYVSPSGARAASAGTFILLSSHVAAMAPNTTVGAATPVQMGQTGRAGPGERVQLQELIEALGEGGSNGQTDGGGADSGANENSDGGDSGQDAPSNDQALKNKAMEDAVAYIRTLAERHGRNADWAEKAVREAATLTSAEAREQNVADIAPENRSALAEAMDGLTVQMAEGGEPLTLATAGAEIVEIERSWREELLATITNPNVAFILMLVGIYGIIFELINPGALVPGTLGGICLLLGLYAMAVLPVSYAGAGLLLLGIALMVAEAFSPSFGVLGIGGLVAFVLGGVFLFEPGLPGFAISPWTIGITAAVSAGLLVLVVRLVWRAHRRPKAIGDDQLVGSGDTGEIETWEAGRGLIRYQGELWRAQGPDDLVPGQAVAVRKRSGLTLHVAPAGDGAGAAPS